MTKISKRGNIRQNWRWILNSQLRHTGEFSNSTVVIITKRAVCGAHCGMSPDPTFRTIYSFSQLLRV
jgi:hypothetical protein